MLVPEVRLKGDDDGGSQLAKKKVYLSSAIVSPPFPMTCPATLLQLLHTILFEYQMNLKPYSLGIPWDEEF